MIAAKTKNSTFVLCTHTTAHEEAKCPARKAAMASMVTLECCVMLTEPTEVPEGIFILS